MIAFDLKLNEKDGMTVEVWVKQAGRNAFITTIHKDWMDDAEIFRKLEDGETVAVSVREI